jgi:penicillin-binding protein 1A
MRAAHEHKPASEFPRPAGVRVVTIDARSGLLPFEGDTETLDEVFLDGTEPTVVAGAALMPTTPDADASPSAAFP